ncbi:chromate transporter [Ancylobacter mangrovi]|uniref:Chromate transporter n=1 Tax=Ancylobacter mangrovi TaxID=2972472 RepID=A0A9X2T506_9HYPH|nr:chromate transporter [Ancylobacter mangrovi]MCS0494919.1 chromate transporter [Ancylobacter mangrovi]MCS0502314.1 chromate transporter [Ancylobacter mangrovi]
MNDSNPLVALALHFLAISIFAVGGANVVLPEIHRQVVDVAGWMSDVQFAQNYAIAQAAPGPNMLVVTLIGWHVAGVWGAIVATLAMTGPTCVIAYVVGGIWHRFRAARWRRVVQGALVPLTVGLIIASGLILAEGAARSYATAAYTAVTMVVLLLTRISPIWLMAGGAILGAAGLI